MASVAPQTTSPRPHARSRRHPAPSRWTGFRPGIWRWRTTLRRHRGRNRSPFGSCSSTALRPRTVPSQATPLRLRDRSTSLGPRCLWSTCRLCTARSRRQALSVPAPRGSGATPTPRQQAPRPRVRACRGLERAYARTSHSACLFAGDPTNWWRRPASDHLASPSIIEVIPTEPHHERRIRRIGALEVVECPLPATYRTSSAQLSGCTEDAGQRIEWLGQLWTTVPLPAQPAPGPAAVTAPPRPDTRESLHPPLGAGQAKAQARSEPRAGWDSSRNTGG